MTAPSPWRTSLLGHDCRSSDASFAFLLIEFQFVCVRQVLASQVRAAIHGLWRSNYDETDEAKHDQLSFQLLSAASGRLVLGRQRRLDKGKPRVTLAAGYNALNFGYASMLLLQVADLAPVHHLGETCWGYVRRSTKVPLESWGICSAEDLLLFAKETKWPREADDALESLGLKGLSETARAVHWTFALLGFCETCLEAFVTKEYKIQHRPLALQCLASLADLAASVSTVNLRPRDVDGEAASVSTVKELIAAADWQPPVRHDDELPPAKVARKCIDANFVAKIYWPLCKARLSSCARTVAELDAVCAGLGCLRPRVHGRAYAGGLSEPVCTTPCFTVS